MVDYFHSVRPPTLKQIDNRFKSEWIDKTGQKIPHKDICIQIINSKASYTNYVVKNLPYYIVYYIPPKVRVIFQIDKKGIAIEILDDKHFSNNSVCFGIKI